MLQGLEARPVYEAAAESLPGMLPLRKESVVVKLSWRYESWRLGAGLGAMAMGAVLVRFAMMGERAGVRGVSGIIT